MIAALGMLRGLQRQAEAEVVRLSKQAQAMANAIKVLEAKRVVLKAKRATTSAITPEGKARIRAAQKARWQAYHKQQSQLARKGK